MIDVMTRMKETPRGRRRTLVAFYVEHDDHQGPDKGQQIIRYLVIKALGHYLPSHMNIGDLTTTTLPTATDVTPPQILPQLNVAREDV